MSIESEIQAQLDFLRRPDTTWVRNFPKRPNQSCAVCRIDGSHWVMIESSATEWLRTWFWKTYKDPGVMVWNDCFASGRDEVVERLEKAVAAAGEQGA